MVTFLDLKNAFGSVHHQLISRAVIRVPPPVLNHFIQSYLLVLLLRTLPIPFNHGVFQGDIMSPIMFLLGINPLLHLATKLNYGHGYSIQLPLPNSEDLPPIDSSIYVKWTEQGNKPPGWYRGYISEYFQGGSCRIVYDDTPTEILNLRSVDWLPCSKRTKHYVSFNCSPKILKSK